MGEGPTLSQPAPERILTLLRAMAMWRRALRRVDAAGGPAGLVVADE